MISLTLGISPEEENDGFAIEGMVRGRYVLFACVITFIVRATILVHANINSQNAVYVTH